MSNQVLFLAHSSVKHYIKDICHAIERNLVKPATSLSCLSALPTYEPLRIMCRLANGLLCCQKLLLKRRTSVQPSTVRYGSNRSAVKRGTVNSEVMLNSVLNLGR